MELNYEQDLQIDEQALDVEWTVTQEILALKYIRHYVLCAKNLSLCHEELKTKRSELIRDANLDPERCCKKKKPTAGDLEAYYRTHKDYKEIKNRLIDLEYEKSIAEFVRREICYTRKTALEELGKLIAQQYFAGPKAPRNLHKEANKRREVLKESNIKKIGKKMKRKISKNKRS